MSKLFKYRIHTHRGWSVTPKIFKVEIEKESKKSVWLKHGRELKKTEWQEYYDTWQSAYNALYGNQRKRNDSLKKQLEDSENILRQIKEMYAKRCMQKKGGLKKNG